MTKVNNSSPEIPFYGNTKDNTHCVQAVVRMVLKYFLPEKNFTWKQLEKLTVKKKGLWTWPTQEVINLRKMGFEVIKFSTFDSREFFKKGKKYLEQKYGKKVAEAQDKNSDLEFEIDSTREYLDSYPDEKPYLPSLSDVKKLIRQGYLVACGVNSRKLNGKAGYSGHRVLVLRISDDHIWLHDPGLPPRKNRKVSIKRFLKAWEYPSKDSRNLFAYRYNRGNVSSDR